MAHNSWYAGIEERSLAPHCNKNLYMCGKFVDAWL